MNIRLVVLHFFLWLFLPLGKAQARAITNAQVENWLKEQKVSYSKESDYISIQYNLGAQEVEVHSVDIYSPKGQEILEVLKKQWQEDRSANPKLNTEVSREAEVDSRVMEQILQEHLPDFKTHQVYKSYLDKEFKQQIAKESKFGQFINNHSRLLLTVMRTFASGVPTFWSYHLSSSYSLEAALVLGAVSGAMSGLVQYKSELYLDFLAKKLNFHWPSKENHQKGFMSLATNEYSNGLGAHTKWFFTEMFFLSVLQTTSMAFTQESIHPLTAVIVVLSGSLLATFQQGSLENVTSFYYSKKKKSIHKKFIRESKSKLKKSLLLAIHNFNEYKAEFDRASESTQKQMALELEHLRVEKEVATIGFLQQAGGEELYELNKAHRIPELKSHVGFAMISFVSMGLITSLMAGAPFFADTLVEFSNPFFGKLGGFGGDEVLRITNVHAIISFIGLSGLTYYYRLQSQYKKQEATQPLLCQSLFAL